MGGPEVAVYMTENARVEQMPERSEISGSGSVYNQET